VTKRLIVNADDLGYTPGVTRGIIRAHREGIVTSSSVLVNSPFAAEAIQTAMREAPALGLGLHLTLTSGRPILHANQVPNLVTPQGVFKNRTDYISGLPSIDSAQVEMELRAQIDRFIDLAGHPPDHLDSHHHATYLAPAVARTMLQMAAHGDTIESEVGAMLTELSIPAPDYFSIRFYGPTATLGDLLNLLMDLPEGITELMCHPAEIDEGLAASSYVDGRASELAALTHSAAREVIRAEGISLITFDALRQGRPA
jgi:predicted glycoside hydrolase/deacetylase ChbG (UPF0249 family)